MNDAAAGPRTSAEAEVHQGQHHAQEGDDQRDHFGEASALGPPFAWAPAYAEPTMLVDAWPVLVDCREAPHIETFPCWQLMSGS